MQSFKIPKNFIRQSASSLYYSGGESGNFNNERLYMVLFDKLPSSTFFNKCGKWVNDKLTRAEFAHQYLTESGFCVLSEHYFSNEFISQYVDKDDLYGGHYIDPSSAKSKLEREAIEQRNYFNRVNWRLYVKREENLLVEYNCDTGITILYDHCEPFYQNTLGRFGNDYLSHIETSYGVEEPSRVHYISIDRSIKDTYEFFLDDLEIEHKNDFGIDKIYNDDFSKFDEKIRSFINTPKRSGLVILHGLQGTGKTTYIKELITATDNSYVFVPMDVANKLTSPDFIEFVKEELKESVIILEDCEQLLFDRSQTADHINTGLAAILNLTDGILGDALGLKIICTFNNSLCNIDPALLRPGRLVARYEFAPLSAEKTTSLMNQLGHEGSFSPMTLAEIFNQ